MSTQKALSSSPYAGGARKIYAVDQDPSAVTLDVEDIEKGDLILFIDDTVSTSKPALYFKLTDGPDNEVERIIKRHNYDAAGIPGGTNDITEGYYQGSEWYNGTDLYKCVNHTIGGAVWLQIN